MNILRGIAGLTLALITLPIWLYLVYKILQMVGATELMWFLYWIYIPASFFGAGVLHLTKEQS